MKILSWNVNGLRSFYKQGYLSWLGQTKAEIICLQEIKVDGGQLPFFLTNVEDYLFYFNPASRKGYGGVAVYTKEKPLKVISSMGFEKFDKEGRFLQLDYPEFKLINLYLPLGRGKGNYEYKLSVYEQLLNYLEKIKNEKVIVAGDFNIAHEAIDLARPKQNQKNIMFTLEERKKLNEIVDLGFIDSFRKFHKDGGNYTWWPYFVNARKRNLGWRIDYVFISRSWASFLKDAFILSKVTGSDHCPIGIEIEGR